MKPPLLRLAALSALLAGASSCRTIDHAFDQLDVINLPETRAYNLEQLHRADHHHRYLAHQTGDVQYLMKKGIGTFQPGRHLYDETQVEKIDDPTITCLAELVSLCKFDPSDVKTSSLQVEWCVRIATEDSWRLSRERALFELGRAALRLDVGVPQPVDPASVDSVETVVDSITLLIRAYRPTIERGESGMTADEWEAFDDSVETLRGLTYDLESGRRALKAVTALIGPAGRNSRVRSKLDPLALDLQRTLVSQAIDAGLRDPMPAVRAVAIHNAVLSGGDVVLAQALTQLNPESSEEVIDGVMRLVEVYDLPEENAELSGERYRMARMQWLAIIVDFAVNHPSGTVRVRCMRALQTASGADVDSLREEDWQEWWDGVVEAERAKREAPVPLLP